MVRERRLERRIETSTVKLNQFTRFLVDFAQKAINSQNAKTEWQLRVVNQTQNTISVDLARINMAGSNATAFDTLGRDARSAVEYRSSFDMYHLLSPQVFMMVMHGFSNKAIKILLRQWNLLDISPGRPWLRRANPPASLVDVLNEVPGNAIGRCWGRDCKLR